MKKVLAIDPGTKNVGLAIGYGDIAEPLKIIENLSSKNLQNKLEKEICKIIEEENIDTIIIGNNKGLQKVSKDSKNIESILKVCLPAKTKIVFVDESHTTNNSKTKALKAGIAQKKRRKDHAIAACELIHRYYEQTQRQNTS